MAFTTSRKSVVRGRPRDCTSGSGHLTPKLGIGARHDGGDAETGFGVELGGGVTWTDPALGPSLDLSGRTLIAHGSDDLEDRGFAASMVFDPDPATQRGASLTLTQDWGGPAQGGLDALFAPDSLDKRSGSEATAAGRPRRLGASPISAGPSPAARTWRLGSPPARATTRSAGGSRRGQCQRARCLLRCEGDAQGERLGGDRAHDRDRSNLPLVTVRWRQGRTGPDDRHTPMIAPMACPTRSAASSTSLSPR